MEASETSSELSAEDIENVKKGQKVSQAAATAVQDATTEAEAREKATAAMREEAKAQALDLSDDSISKIVDMMIERMNSLGAFDPPPAPAAPEGTEQPAHPTPEHAAAVAAAAAASAPAPRKQSWAERHGFGE